MEEGEQSNSGFINNTEMDVRTSQVQGGMLSRPTSNWNAKQRLDDETLDSYGGSGGSYTEEPNFYGASYPPQMYGQIMPYSNSSPPDMPPANYVHPLVNQGYYEYSGPPAHHQRFAGYQQHPSAPAYYYGQPHAYDSPYYPVKPHYNGNRYHGPPRRNSKGYHPNNGHHGNARVNYGYEEYDVNSESSTLTFSGIFSEDIRRAISFVKRNRNATLFSIEGYIAEVAIADDQTRRFVQERFKIGTEDERRLGMAAALNSFPMLSHDEKGSSVLQDIFTVGNDETREELLSAIYNAGVIELSMNIHGCRLMQKAIRTIDQEDLAKLIEEFRDQVIPMIYDSHGNHVIQRFIQAMSFHAKDAEKEGDMDAVSKILDELQFLIDEIITNIESLSLHRYGCRVVQRSIEYCLDRQSHAVLEAICQCNENIVEDLYGNYVVQQAIVTGSEMHREAILNSLTKKQGNIFRLSKQKYASNVVEKLMMYGTTEQKNLILKEILTIHERTGLSSAILLAQDPIANYVVKKAMETAPEGEQKQQLLLVLSTNRDELVSMLGVCL